MASLRLEPGASIGEHHHVDAAEVYLVLDGQGIGLLDGVRFPVGPGDTWGRSSGHAHGLDVGTHAPLRRLAVLT
ncbi:MAG: cupin domain-containing protein [Thermoanaerobaculaceae bacterium]|nr:cupin domain-containing protein [Thermoanaerobaculaceae bacterium]MDI9620661.1 cupin domain-containing protein [Acidobacteriota bacterium]NLH10270.1 cupin domain-containing protein [Holophagae bacterium]HPW55305.1 cupin domain-containing protein [Thermoanaerobaculaceae bacterium]